MAASDITGADALDRDDFGLIIDPDRLRRGWPAPARRVSPPFAEAVPPLAARPAPASRRRLAPVSPVRLAKRTNIADMQIDRSAAACPPAPF